MGYMCVSVLDLLLSWSFFICFLAFYFLLYQLSVHFFGILYIGTFVFFANLLEFRI